METQLSSREAEIISDERKLLKLEEGLAQENIELNLECEHLEKREEKAASLEGHYQRSVASFNARFAE